MARGMHNDVTDAVKVYESRSRARSWLIETPKWGRRAHQEGRCNECPHAVWPSHGETMAFWIGTAVRPPLPAAAGFALARPEGPSIERYGYTWIRHRDGLYYGPLFPGDDDHLVWLEERRALGHSSVRRGEYRYFLRVPAEVDETAIR
jgi:hypothetical protein